MRTNSRSAKIKNDIPADFVPQDLLGALFSRLLVTNTLRDRKSIIRNEDCRWRCEVSLLEAIIIYLSAGAPFGVLGFFSQKSVAASTSIFYALAATLAWPFFGSYRLYKSISRSTDRNTGSLAGESPLETLKALIIEDPTEASELFEIAGHSNPWLATNCYVRTRRRVIESHIGRLSSDDTSSHNNPESIEVIPRNAKFSAQNSVIGS